VLVCANAASAQFRAAIQGTVTDPQGAAVVGATVTLTSKETNKAQQTTSSDEGTYRFEFLAPGHYEITAAAATFKKKVLEDVVINAEQTQGLNITLETGEISETVTVSSEVTEKLQTENATIGGAISTREIQRLPQFGRDPYNLIRLTPGVFGLGGRNGNGDGWGSRTGIRPGGPAATSLTPRTGLRSAPAASA